MKTQRISMVWVLVLMLGLTSVGYAQDDVTSITVEGLLIDGDEILDGEYDLLFRLFDAPEGGNQVGVDFFSMGVIVSAGYYSEVLDFEVNIYDGQTRWLEIAYRPTGFTTPCRVIWAPRSEVRRTHHTILAETISIGMSKPYKALTVSTGSKNDGLWILSRSGKGAAALLVNMAPGNWNGLTKAGDKMLLWKGSEPSDPDAGGLVIGPWGPQLNGIRISATGDVGIGTKTPAQKLDVRGTIRCTSVQQTSDEQFKTNVTELTNVLDKVEKIRGVSFEWNDKADSEGAKVGQKQIGVVAQEVETVFPELVASSPEGYKSVDYTKLTAVLVEAVKDLKAENEALKNRIEALETTQD